MSDNPWRTLGDYQTEQKEARERHAMFQEQHRLLVENQKQLAWSQRLNIVLVLATLIAAFANVWGAYQTSRPQLPEQTTAESKTAPAPISNASASGSYKK